jgi:hypothetical protein
MVCGNPGRVSCGPLIGSLQYMQDGCLERIDNIFLLLIISCFLGFTCLAALLFQIHDQFLLGLICITASKSYILVFV